MKILPSARFIARNGGGVFLGVRFAFPGSYILEDGMTGAPTARVTEAAVSFGLVLWMVTLIFRWNRQKII